jgi:hypothetical protein
MLLRNRLIRIVLAIIIAIFSIVIYYYNSESYIVKLATEARDYAVKKYNSKPKRYLDEGVYLFYRDYSGLTTRVNDFGKATFNYKKLGKQKIRFSFSSKELIIDYPYPYSYSIPEYEKPEKISKKIYGVNINSYFDSKIFNHVKERIVFKDSWVFDDSFGNDRWIFFIKEWEILDWESNTVISPSLWGIWPQKK